LRYDISAVSSRGSKISVDRQETLGICGMIKSVIKTGFGS